MKIQELAIIFIIIILPISLLLSEYTQFQIQTLNMQASYDAKLTAATYDAIKAFQLNAQNETYSDLATQEAEDLPASINTFKNSIMSAFNLTGYTETELDNYIPALVYTLYDGIYIYSPYNNVNYRYQNPATGETITDTKQVSGIKADGNGENLYGIKPYINYSCRYIKGNIDVVITYTLDNHVTVRGLIDGEYVNKDGYLIDNINISTNKVMYNGVEIIEEQLKETVGNNTYNFIKNNGIKYYLAGDQIINISNGKILVQFSRGDENFDYWENQILHNTNAKQYYESAYEFTKWFKDETNLDSLQYSDAYEVNVDKEKGNTSIAKIWPADNRIVFDFNSTTNAKDNIENELSNFNQHRLAVIRNVIEKNLTIAISNYNNYSKVSNVFQMPELKEEEWNHITHNISLISFLQGLPIGGKIYNGYTLVTNSESKEVVLEENIYLLGSDGSYHRIGDKGFEDGTVSLVDGVYGKKISAGRLNIDFERSKLTDSTQTVYYYPLKAYNASYDSIVMQNNVTTYDDIYEYVNSQSDDLKRAFYTALGRERQSKYNNNITQDNGLYIPNGYNVVEGTNLDNGLVIQDASGNQFVWVEVPKNSTVYDEIGTDIDLDNLTGTALTTALNNIETELKEYAEAYRDASYSDRWYSEAQHGFASKDDYNELKYKMLKSVYKNGGFYIGRYETGTATVRTSSSDALTNAIIQQNAYPYNFVSNKQAQSLASGMSSGDYTCSLMFGIQWDLVMKYLETKGATQEELKGTTTGSSNWGNYRNSTYTITNESAKYWKNTTDGWQEGAYGEKTSGTSVLLSTGADNQFSKMGIYDLAGNVKEMTLEHGYQIALPCSVRSGDYSDYGYNFPAVHRFERGTGGGNRYQGFRVALYKDE